MIYDVFILFLKNQERTLQNKLNTKTGEDRQYQQYQQQKKQKITTNQIKIKSWQN